jgi:hypothetical protein
MKGTLIKLMVGSLKINHSLNATAKLISQVQKLADLCHFLDLGKNEKIMCCISSLVELLFTDLPELFQSSRGNANQQRLENAYHRIWIGFKNLLAPSLEAGQRDKTGKYPLYDSQETFEERKKT